MSEGNTSRTSVEGGVGLPQLNKYDVWDTCCTIEDDHETYVYTHVQDIIRKYNDFGQLTY
jgi:hypothetical protein